MGASGMIDVLAWGLDAVRMLQRGANSGLTLAMKGLSLIGSGGLYAVALLMIYWCIDRRLGARIGLLILPLAIGLSRIYLGVHFLLMSWRAGRSAALLPRAAFFSATGSSACSPASVSW
jgi:hypothetical protein